MNRFLGWLKKPRIRLVIVVAIVGLTIAAFGYYLATHPDVLPLIFSLHPAALTLLALAYIGTIIANAFVLGASLRMIGKPVGFSENVSLTGYSSVVNFFGPLQSGPGFRAAYLKKRHGVGIGKFFYATLVFYGFFALINGLVILVALLIGVPNEAAPLVIIGCVLVVILAAVAASHFVPRVRSLFKSVRMNDLNFWLIGIGTLALSLCAAAAYYIELLHVDPSVNFMQAIVYAAAANLSLFVSLTPGAIGFRESFLLLTQQLHQIPGDVVLAASIIDRAFYVIFLLVMFLGLLAFGVRTKFTAGKQP